MAQKLVERGGWLFKEEPTAYNYATLEKEGTTMWTDVHNPLALKYLRQVKAGDRVLYYHTGKERAIVGEMRAVSDAGTDPGQDDPKSVIVEVEAVRRWQPPVTLDQIKKEPLFAQWELVRLPRLSVMPVSPEQWQTLEKLRQQSV